MRNEVYGEVRVDISVPIDAMDNELGVLEANYRMDIERIAYAEIKIIDLNGKVNTVKVHNLEIINLDRFTDE
ncbi:hypothetical protein CHH83_02705 [Bacillus sp. 7586-K]|nr:hypothetical protein CHH83_02705 [Bacillus sp. 7586-K]